MEVLFLLFFEYRDQDFFFFFLGGRHGKTGGSGRVQVGSIGLRVKRVAG